MAGTRNTAQPSDLRAADTALMIAAAAGMFVSIQSWFDRHSGIQKEPGTMLVIIACALILVGLAVVLCTQSAGIRRLFDALILLAAALTALAAWFLMSWWLMAAMLITLAIQIIRMTGPRPVTGDSR